MQEEADTRMMLHVQDCSLHFPSVIIRSPDTDVFLLLLAHIKTFNKPVYMDTGFGNNRRILNIKAIANELRPGTCGALLGLHAFTGCDTTSAFMRKEKLQPMNMMLKSQEYIDAFNDLGETEVISPQLLISLEKFTCNMYGHKRQNNQDKNINECRFEKFIQKCHHKERFDIDSIGIDISLIPPCKSSLILHIKRANFQTLLWRKSLQSMHQYNPANHGWIINNGQLEIQWTENNVIPSDLKDIIINKNVCFAEEDVNEFDEVIFDDNDYIDEI